MQENKIIKILIPVVAVVIIFESIMLVSNLEKGSKTSENVSVIPTVTETKKKEVSAVDLLLTTANTEMKVGKSYKVELNLVGKKDLFVDGIETYVKYNPELVTVNGLVSNNKLPKATLSKVDAVNGIIKNIILMEDKEGFKIVKDQVNQVLTFNVVPKKEGIIEFEISSGNDNKEFVTLVVETTTSKALNFTSGKLEINATK